MGKSSYGFEIFEMDNYRERLQYLVKNESSSLNSFQDFFINGISPKESVILKSINKSVTNRMSHLAGMLSKHDEGWQLYAVKDGPRDARFVPHKFYAPLRSVMEFQRMFSQTQVLLCYFEERKKAFYDIDKDKRMSLFIADWVYFHWWKLKKAF